MSYSLPVNITISLSFLIFLLYVLGFHNIFTSFQKNDCEMTFMFQYPQFVEISFPLEVHKAYSKYALYGYGEGGTTEQLRKMKFKGIPVLFIPGSSGSYKQGRSLASVSLRKSLNSRTPFHFNYFMIDFNEEQSALFGGVLKDQTKFVLQCIKKILTLYENNEDSKKPKSVILIGHSMGGLLAKGVFMNPEFDSKLVRLVISLATPHKYPLFQPDYLITSYYKDLNNFWQNNPDLNHTFMISIGGGLKDILVHSDVTFDPYSDINVLTTAVPGVWLPNDHLSIMWCKQLVVTLIRGIFDSVNISTKQISTEKEYIKKVFEYHFLKRSAGKKFLGSFTSRFSSFERSLNWFENLQRQFTITEPKGLNATHYIMIRLFSDPKSEAAFIEAFNVNVKDWIFVCSADVVYNSLRMCETGENLSNMTKIAPIDMKLKLKRKFVYLNLLELKAKSFTHAVIKLPPSNNYMSVNVDVHQPFDRNLSHKVPKYYSLSSETVIEKTEENSAFYSIHLIGFEYIWQSFILKLTVLSCKSEKNQAVVSFITPWSHEDQHFIFYPIFPLRVVSQKALVSIYRTFSLFPLSSEWSDHSKTFWSKVARTVFCDEGGRKILALHAFEPMHTVEKNMLSVPLNLVTPKPKNYNVTSYPFVKLHLDPTCKYHVSIQSSVIGMFGQGARYYSVMLPAFIATVILLTLRQEMKHLNEGKCLLLHSALSSAVRPYYIVLQASVLGSKFLGLGFFLSVLPEPDFLTLQELNLDSIFLTILLYAVAIVFAYSLGAAVYVSVILSGQAAEKLALRFIAKAISGVFSWSEWIIATLHQVPFFVVIILISLSVSTTGALSLWLGACFYFLKLCKMYEEYFQNWFNYSLKFLAKKVKEVIVRKPNENTQASKKMNESAEPEIQDRKVENLEKSESDPGGVVSLSDENESEADLLSAIHFHISVFMIWLLIAFLYIPSLMFWVKNYYYSASLENDPAFVPSIVVSACGAVLWQPDVPKSCKKLNKLTSWSLFFLAIVSIIYASLSLYRLGYILSASLLVVTLNQVSSNYLHS